MEGKEGVHGSDYRTITVRTSDGSTIQGKLNIGGKDRVSDIFTSDEKPFIVMVDVFLRDGQGKVLFINKEHIVWVEPEE